MARIPGSGPGHVGGVRALRGGHPSGADVATLVRGGAHHRLSRLVPLWEILGPTIRDCLASAGIRALVAASLSGRAALSRELGKRSMPRSNSSGQSPLQGFSALEGQEAARAKETLWLGFCTAASPRRSSPRPSYRGDTTNLYLRDPVTAARRGRCKACRRVEPVRRESPLPR